MTGKYLMFYMDEHPGRLPKCSIFRGNTISWNPLPSYNTMQFQTNFESLIHCIKVIVDISFSNWLVHIGPE